MQEPGLVGWKVPMSDSFSLRSNGQRKILRWLVMCMPIVLFYSICWVFENFFNLVLPGPHIAVNEIFSAVYFWCIPVPLFYFYFLARVYSDRILIKNGSIFYGFLGRESLPLASLEEVAGDGGTL